MVAYVHILAVWKCALVSTMPAGSTLQRRGATLSTLWVVFQSLITIWLQFAQVEKIVRHPQFDAKRLSDDIAVMITSRVVGEASSSSACWWKDQQHCWFSLSQCWDCFLLQTCNTPMCPLPVSPPANNSLITSSATAQEQGSVFCIISTIVPIISYFRCWTAGWGKDEFSGSFQFIQHKVGPLCKWQHRKIS